MGFVDSLRGVVRSFTGENDDDYYEYEGVQDNGGAQGDVYGGVNMTSPPRRIIVALISSSKRRSPRLYRMQWYPKSC